MDLGLADRVYLVTGGGRGLGRATADVLVAEGARVVLSGRSEETLAAAVEALGDHATYVVGDNADPGTPGRLIAAARERWGRIDGGLISVGGPPTGSITSTTDEQWTTSFAAVFLGAVRTAREHRWLDRVRPLDQREGSVDRDGDLERTAARAGDGRQAVG
jgi:3-oxoacyl-[acyl-carrier protein] reductase